MKTSQSDENHSPDYLSFGNVYSKEPTEENLMRLAKVRLPIGKLDPTLDLLYRGDFSLPSRKMLLRHRAILFFARERFQEALYFSTEYLEVYAANLIVARINVFSKIELSQLEPEDKLTRPLIDAKETEEGVIIAKLARSLRVGNYNRAKHFCHDILKMAEIGDLALEHILTTAIQLNDFELLSSGLNMCSMSSRAPVCKDENIRRKRLMRQMLYKRVIHLIQLSKGNTTNV